MSARLISARSCLALAGLIGLSWASMPSALAADPGGIFEWRPFLGPFHSILLHFPIGFVTMAFLVDLYSLWRRKVEYQPVITLMLGLSVVATVVTILLGLMRGTGGEYDPQMLEHHRNYGIAVGVLTVAAFLFQWLAFRPSAQGTSMTVPRGIYRVVLLGTIVMLTIAGHDGGNLTHGSNYLTKNAPEFVRTLVEGDPEPAVNSATAGNAQEQFFLEKVRPTFDAKCLSCHGPEKQKGGFRIDQADLVLKGGESGKPAVTPGDPFASHLIRLIILPPDHDDVMPPAGKMALTSDEVLNIIRWVQQGAQLPGRARLETPPSTNGP